MYRSVFISFKVNLLYKVHVETVVLLVNPHTDQMV